MGRDVGIKKKIEAPTAYAVLSCLTSCDPGSFTDFCGDFGYDEDSKKAETIYQAVRKEWSDIVALFSTEEREQLVEIQ